MITSSRTEGRGDDDRQERERDSDPVPAQVPIARAILPALGEE